MLGRALWGLVGLLVVTLLSSGLLIFIHKPLRSRKYERYAARFNAEATGVYRNTGRCPDVEELESLAERPLCPSPRLCLYYEPANCAVGYPARNHQFFEYRVREQRWYSSEELRSNSPAR